MSNLLEGFFDNQRQRLGKVVQYDDCIQRRIGHGSFAQALGYGDINYLNISVDPGQAFEFEIRGAPFLFQVILRQQVHGRRAEYGLLLTRHWQMEPGHGFEERRVGTTTGGNDETHDRTDSYLRGCMLSDPAFVGGNVHSDFVV